MNIIINRVAAALLAVLTLSGVLFAESYKVDPSHSSIGFTIRHMVSKVHGRFTDFDGTIQYDEKDLSTMAVQFTVWSKSINTDNEDRDKNLRGKDFFEADSFPTISFKSSKAYKNEQGTFLEGTLVLHGVSKPVTVPFEMLGTASRKGNAVLGFSAEFTINRKDYDIVWNRAIDKGGMLLSDDVKVQVEIEAALEEGFK